MNDAQIKGLLGLAVRAGQACFGEDNCRRLAGSGQCGALLIDGEASEKTRRRYEELAKRTDTVLVLLPPGMIPAATGKDNMAMALRKGSFAERVTGSPS